MGDTYLLPWTRSPEIRDAPVGRHWRLMARCILQSLQACLPTALCHDHTKSITTTRPDRDIFILILVSLYICSHQLTSNTGLDVSTLFMRLIYYCQTLSSVQERKKRKETWVSLYKDREPPNTKKTIATSSTFDKSISKQQSRYRRQTCYRPRSDWPKRKSQGR